jgi:hypothetical protein
VPAAFALSVIGVHTIRRSHLWHECLAQSAGLLARRALVRLPQPPCTFLIRRTGLSAPRCWISAAISTAARARKCAVASSIPSRPSIGAAAWRMVLSNPSSPPSSTARFLHPSRPAGVAARRAPAEVLFRVVNLVFGRQQCASADLRHLAEDREFSMADL